jgi:hypothetical protein
MIDKIGFAVTLSDGRQYTLWRGRDLIPPDAVEVSDRSRLCDVHAPPTP